MNGFIIAGTHSGCGKTTITLGLMAALREKGMSVQPFKAGPDFIDAGLHRMVTGRTSLNLDLWMCGEEYVKTCYERYSSDADISVVEGVMGLYDGKFSTAMLAITLNIPVVLVVDAYGMAETAGAIVKGIQEYGKAKMEYGIWNMEKLQSDISFPSFSGVIFNRVASERHYERLSKAVEDMPVLGYLPRELNFEIPHRHLGLTTAEDNPISDENMGRLADAVSRCIDVQKIMDDGKWKMEEKTKTGSVSSPILHPASNIRIAIAYDRAFCFYYEDNINMLRDAGAEIVCFSPMNDSKLPADLDGIYIGGGYPELHAEQLSKNIAMRNALKEWAESDGVIYAECGGLMYLTKCIKMNNGKSFDMAGIFPFATEMKKRLARLGYREVALNAKCILGEPGTVLRGHEFHYSDIADLSEVKTDTCYTVRNQEGAALPMEGYTYRNVLGSYIHIHFGSNRNSVMSMIDFMKERGKL